MLIEISLGEAIDRLSILNLKQEVYLTKKSALPQIGDNLKTQIKELTELIEKEKRALPEDILCDVKRYERDLESINLRLWLIEDNLRFLEKIHKTHESIFEDLARQVYKSNDKRAEAKRIIDAITESKNSEEKLYNL